MAKKTFKQLYDEGELNPFINSAGTFIGGAVSGGNQSDIGNLLGGLGSVAGVIPGVGPIAGAGLSLAGGVVM